jgi:hypothetical protein
LLRRIEPLAAEDAEPAANLDRVIQIDVPPDAPLRVATHRDPGVSCT